MNTYQPFIDDSVRLAALDRQRFVVLRAPGVLHREFTRAQASVRQQFAGWPISYPAQPHITLCGFAAGTSLRHVQQLVTDWAPTVAATLDLEIARAAAFPPPFQIAIIEVVKTPT